MRFGRVYILTCVCCSLRVVINFESWNVTQSAESRTQVSTQARNGENKNRLYLFSAKNDIRQKKLSDLGL